MASCPQDLNLKKDQDDEMQVWVSRNSRGRPGDLVAQRKLLTFLYSGHSRSLLREKFSGPRMKEGGDGRGKA